jgi:hypothetical protein
VNAALLFKKKIPWPGRDDDIAASAAAQILPDSDFALKDSCKRVG